MLFFLVTIFLVFLFDSQDAFAAVDNEGILNAVSDGFRRQAMMWGQKMMSYASWLFWTLAVISMIFTFGFLIFEGSDFNKFFGTLIRFIITLGFFWWLLTNGTNIAVAIIGSMQRIGAGVGGSSVTSASGVMSVAFKVFDTIQEGVSITSPAVSIGLVLIACVSLLVMAMIAVNLTLEYCSAWVLCFAGIFVLGFGSTSWTRDMAITYFKTVLACAMRIMTMLLLIGIAENLITTFHSQMDKSVTLADAVTMLLVGVVLFRLTNLLPPIVSSLISGVNAHSTGTVGGGGLIGGAGGLIGGAVGATAGIAAGAALAGVGATRAAAQVAGVGRAVGTALSKAHDSVASNSAGSGASQAGGASRIGNLLSRGGQAGAQAVANLGQAGAQMAGQAVNNRINQTVGGRMASKIKENSEG